MTNFSTNQVMQFYVHVPESVEGKKDGHYLVVDKKFADGSFSMAITSDGKEPKAADKNALGRTDKIENVMWAKLTKAAKLATPLKEATLTFNTAVNGGKPIVGQDYILKVSYPSVGGVGIEGWTTKVAAAYADKNASVETIAAALIKNLNAAFEADGVLEAKAGETAGTIVISQTTLAIDSYERGIRPVTIADFRVVATPVVEEGEEVDWLDEASYKTVESDTKVSGSYKLADMEYFAMGERGDEYRMAGYPNYIKTAYKIVPGKEYDVYTIHFAYKGANDQSHKSEKDLIIAVPEGTTITDLSEALTALGVTLEVRS
jgi:hypothetical protein